MGPACDGLTGPTAALMPSAMSGLIDDLAPAERLALAYAPAQGRTATLAVLALDARLAAILRARREPIAAQLRLAWWRDMLALPAADWPRGEPVLDLLRGWRDPSGLVPLAVGWEALLADALTEEVIAEFVHGRGRAFAALAQELGVDATASAEEAARLWALADLAAHLSDDDERARALAYGRQLAPPPLPASLRPLAVLAGLGARALQRGGKPLLSGFGGTLLALRIGITGR